MTHTLRLEGVVEAAPDVVFDAFTDPAAQHDLYADAPDRIVESEIALPRPLYSMGLTVLFLAVQS